MKQAAAALRGLFGRTSAAVGLEGAFLVVGTVCLAIGASFFSPAGPWLVVGGVGLLVSIALVRAS